MFYLVLYLVLMKAEANILGDENPVIRLSYIDNRNQNFTVWKDKPLKIIHNDNIRYIWCSNFYNKDVYEGSFVPEIEFSKGDHVLNISSVTDEMSTRWVCTALEEYHGPKVYYHKGRNYTATNLYFHLHVKGARAVILKANNQILPYVSTNMSINYDGEANYTYEDGEDFPVDFSCNKAGNKDNNDTLCLEYYDTQGNLLFKTKPRDQRQHIFRFVLKSISNKYYLDCIRAARNPDREYRYRTTFLKRNVHYDTSKHAVILYVNGQKLTTPSNRNESIDNYIFRYIDGEELTVICQKRDPSTSGQLIFSAYKMSLTLQSSNSSTQVFSLNTSDIQNRSLICGINNVKAEKPKARLLFLSDIPGNDVRIRGLPRNNILYQYTNDLNQWTIEYQYSVNETLDLTCVWNEGFSAPRSLTPFEKPFQWHFVDKSFGSTAISIANTKVKFSEVSFTRTLNESDNETKIKCIYAPSGTSESNSIKTVEIILRLKPVIDSEGKTGEYSSDITYVKRMIVPIAVGVGVAIAVITMVCLVSRRKRTKRINLIENAYDNTSYQNDSPIPAFPSQWEDNDDDPNYAKIGEKVIQKNYNCSTDNGKLYRIPDKRQSNVSENHYTEINDDIFPKPDGLAANWNTTQTYDYKQMHTREETSPHSVKNTCYNNFTDSKQGNYDNLRHTNLPNNKINQNYSNVPKSSKRENTFRQTSNDLRSEGKSRQGGGNYESETKPDNDGYNANTGQGNIYTQPEKPNYENNYIESEKTDNQLNTDYAEPYDELGISCKNDLYGY